MQKVGVLVVCYGARETAMVDACARSQNYKVNLYIADKQRNPFNVEKAAIHVVIPDLDIEKICKFAETNKDAIDFAMIGPEKPIIDGVRDLLDNQAVVKPDKPTAGKGVGVWGDHFSTRERLFEHFMSNFQYGTVIIEERIDGEESSFMAFCDGKHLAPLPDTRDHKRAFDDDKGPNTGGMGSYKDTNDYLPFMTKADHESELAIAQKIFTEWTAKTNDPSALRGIPLYLAFMHTRGGPKILENNSRPGDPEIINILPVLKDDFVDLCYNMVEGNLTRVEVDKAATGLTYKVPPSYGGYAEVFPDKVNKRDVDKPVDLKKAYELIRKHSDAVRIYPGSMEMRGGKDFALRSRAVCAVGIADDIEDARSISLEALKNIRGGALR